MTDGINQPIGEEHQLLGEILRKRGKITDDQLMKAIKIQKQSHRPLGEELVKMGVLSEDEVYSALAEQFGIEQILDISGYNFPKELIKQVPYSFAKRHLALPIDERDQTIVIAIHDPLHLDPLDELRLIFDRPIKAVQSPKNVIQEAIRLVYNREAGAASQLISSMEKKDKADLESMESESYDLLDERSGQSPIIKLLNLILTEAIQQGASDIHFEPQESGLRVRYRIDGVLQLRHFPSQEYQAKLLTRIKVMSKLDIAEHRLPQDGRIKLRMGGREIDFRVSTVPIANGERIVLRILDKGNVLLGINRIGMIPSVLAKFKKLIRMPEGIILVTGPTGSGKTTTLYSTISEVYSDETNIMTIEDPVEYKLPNIAQISVHHKIALDFATGLRHILRQDPDIVMIGEIRDIETAEIAIQASLTGHLVMSTLHTNDAPSAITRLVDMGIEPYLLSSSVIGVVAQRLLRTICPSCKTSYIPTDEELRSLHIQRKDLQEGVLCKGAGCNDCMGSGYKGRHGVYEFMPVTNAIKKQIIISPDSLEIRRLAVKEGMVSLRQHGALLALRGMTTEAEVLRVTRGVEED